MPPPTSIEQFRYIRCAKYARDRKGNLRVSGLVQATKLYFVFRVGSGSCFFPTKMGQSGSLFPPAEGRVLFGRGCEKVPIKRILSSSPVPGSRVLLLFITSVGNGPQPRLRGDRCCFPAVAKHPASVREVWRAPFDEQELASPLQGWTLASYSCDQTLQHAYIFLDSKVV